MHSFRFPVNYTLKDMLAKVIVQYGAAHCFSLHHQALLKPGLPWNFLGPQHLSRIPGKGEQIIA